MASRLLLPSARAWLARWRATPPPEGWALFGALVLVQVVAAAARLLPTLGWDTWWAGDPFVYACLADSLVAGRGFHIDYVAMHIQRYAGAHGRPEDYAGPLLPLLMVPFVALLGRVFAAYAAPSILCHALLLPLALRAVALRCGAPVVVAQASAWMSLFHPALFANSQRPMTDVVFATLIVLAVYWSVRLEEGLSRPAWAGVFVGLAALTRSTGQLYLPAFAVANALRCRSWRGLLTREVIVFGAVAMLVQAPWLWRNEREFGRPMHSVGSRLVGLMGRSDRSGEEAMGVWWDRRPPTLADRYRSGAAGRPFQHVAASLADGTVNSLIGLSLPSGDDRIELLSFGCFLAFACLAVGSLWGRRREWPSQLLVCQAAVLIAGTSVMFSAHRARYFYSVYVLVIPYGWWGLHDLVRRLARRRGLADELPARPAARAVVAAAAVFCLASLVMDVGGMRRARWTDYVDPGQAADGIALLRDTARLAPAGQVLLVNFSPPVGSYYSGHPVVGVPRYDDPADLYRVIDHYRCTAAVLTWSPRLAQDLRARGWSTWLERGNWQSWRSPGR